MRSLITLVFVSLTVLSAQTAHGQPAARACAILTKDLVVPFAASKQLLDQFPPEEETLGTSGTACEYGIVRLQLYPVPKARQNRTAPRDFQPISGAGELAFFRNNQNTYAEMVVWTATHNFTLQVGAPTGKSPDAMKPETIALVNAIIAKLR